ncbi:MAG TPA: class I SAM-dependent methyltransferase [Steroidobacteraceae bacterium]|nr:class I SAM-dependent methyltransferase [Steroidobacteraceae bacterium]
MAFDQQYYQRYYLDPRTAVTSRAEMRRRAQLITACTHYVGLPVQRILEVGCGIGLLRAPLLKALPRAEYTGLEVSDYLCQRYGWRKGSIVDFRARGRFELVVCYDVMQYLTAAEARQGIANIGRLCRGALYFGALTREDWEHNCDQRLTDPSVHLRPASWYRRELSRAFRPFGAGFWIRLDAPLVTWELDTAG